MSTEEAGAQKKRLEEEKKMNKSKRACLCSHSLKQEHGDDDITCDLCDEDCVDGVYHYCKSCKFTFCQSCYTKAITAQSELANSETNSQRDLNTDMRLEDYVPGAGEKDSFDDTESDEAN